MARFYTVQETATILGFSTNSIYKFLDQGRLKSTRGNSKQGRFRIPHSSVEDFLGTKLSETAVSKALSTSISPKTVDTPRHLINPNLVNEAPLPKREVQAQPEKKIAPSLPLGLALTRFLILIALVLTIFETITGPTAPLSQVFRFTVLTITILLAYQSGAHEQA